MCRMCVMGSHRAVAGANDVEICRYNQSRRDHTTTFELFVRWKCSERDFFARSQLDLIKQKYHASTESRAFRS